MKSKLGMAVMVLMAVGAFTTSVHAQCGTGPIIEFDNNTWSYESNYDIPNFNSFPGSVLTVVGKITQMCNPPFTVDATDPTKEYTLFMTNLVSAGTVHTVVFGTGMKHETLYSGGDFIIYEDLSPDAPTLATLTPNPPNAQVPASFIDGTVILTGTLSGFDVIVTRGPTGTYTHSFRSNYLFTGPAGGSQYLPVAGNGPGLLHGTWCHNGSAPGLCTLPAGYTAQPNGKFDNPVTAAQRSTWGTLKQLYR